MKPARLAADTAYGTGRLLGWLLGQQIAPHIPVWDKSQRRDGSFSRADFAYDKARDIYIRPAGKTLTTTGPRILFDNTLRYLASTYDCGPCSLKARCCPNTPQRRIPRDVHEDARHTRSLTSTEPFAKSRNERKKVKILFAHLKRHLGFERLHLRGLSGARDEFLIAATVQYLSRLVELTAPPPLPQPA